MRCILFLLRAFTFCFWCSTIECSFASTVNLQIVDQNGNPVADAVVIVPGATIAITGDNPVVIDQVNKSFVPKVSVINMGQSVAFPNSDNIRHHVYSFSEAKTFEIKLYANQPEAPILFDQPGIVIMGCNIHDQMVGYVVVSPSNNWVFTNAQGQATLKVAPDTRQIYLWHTRAQQDINQLQPIRWPVTQSPIVFPLNPVTPNPQAESASPLLDRFRRHGH